jgi:DNA-binding transcriptional ArsR family regulator
MAHHSPLDLDRSFRALADPTRRAILARLARGPASVSELAVPFRMAMPTLLAHIRVLEQGGLVATEKTGRVRTCTIRPPALNATAAWIERQRAVWEARFDRMDAYVAELQARENRRGKRKRG